MKSTKKLLIATLLLVLALTAVVSSTFAWFTMQANPEIENIQVNVTSGEGLRMSLTGEDGTFKSIWTKDEFSEVHGEDLETIELNSITPKFDGENLVPNVFQNILYQIPTTTYDVDGNPTQVPGYYYYADSSGANEEYLSFDLWFEADIPLDVYLQSATVTTEEVKKHSINSARFGFVNYEDSGFLNPKDFHIYNPRSISSPFGSGAFFGWENIRGGFYEMINSPGEEHPALLADNGSGNAFTIKDSLRVTANTNATYITPSERVLVRVPDKGVRVKITVHFWIEGWDGDCIDEAKGAQIDIFMRFIGHKFEEPEV